MRCPLVLCLATLAVALAQERVAAHDLIAKVKLPPDAIIVEVGFDDGTPAQNARVVLADADGREVANGKTDERGLLTMARPGPGRYTATIEAYGHRDVVEFEIAAPATPLESPIEYARERPNQTLGLAIGVGALALASAAFWFARRKRAT